MPSSRAASEAVDHDLSGEESEVASLLSPSHESRRTASESFEGGSNLEDTDIPDAGKPQFVINIPHIDKTGYEVLSEDEDITDIKSDSEPVARQTRSMSTNLGKHGRGATGHGKYFTQFDSEDELSTELPPLKKRLTRTSRAVINGASQGHGRSGRRLNSIVSDESDETPERNTAKPTRSSARIKPKPSHSYGVSLGLDHDQWDEDEEATSDQDFTQVFSDLQPTKKKKTKAGRPGRPSKNGSSKSVTIRSRGRPAKNIESSSEDERRKPTRQSGRNNKSTKSMREVNENDEVFAEETGPSHAPKVMNIREVFQPLPSKSPFRLIHNQSCDVCKNHGSMSSKGPLIHCQGCTISIHKVCLGYRSGREHIVTKVGEDNFVLQCRRCIGLAKKKDPTAPYLNICQKCKVPGAACAAFSHKKTAKHEERMRIENGGKDPVTNIPDHLINNPDNVLFRCVDCQRGFHFECLPPLEDETRAGARDDVTREERIEEYGDDFRCKDCSDLPGDVKGLVAWRPADINTFSPQSTVNDVNPEEKEYLVRWQDLSYFQCTWMSGAWVWGSVATAMKSAFARREENQNPKMTAEDAIPEEYLRMEIIMDVKYTSNVNTHTENIDKARVKEVDEVLVKFQGLGYDEVVWENPPDPSDTERWSDFVAAYNEFLAGKYFKQPPIGMQKRIDDYRRLSFQRHVLLLEQPAALTGGTLMDYQMEGLNWLLFNYHQKKSVILADEMGLGKTLQIIAMITALVKDKPKTWPFLVVVPNSTCPNWRREIKTWAPSLRVVAYYGSKEARNMAMKYELFPNGTKDMKAHIVVTSYETPVDEHSRLFFKKVKWAGVIVDEGQRLKNDKNLLYHALQAINTPFKVLMTGTPLQNNKRELFNLLQFIDDSIDAETLDAEYAELTNENIPLLHEKIKPYFLRRTKATALSFLPPMAQVILPVTMSVVQKQLYKSILSRNSELMRSIFAVGKTTLKPGERGNLNNILMQLRKVLCHPFMFSQAVEERALPQTALHRNLVQASSKLQLLDIMLPKLQERGHRVLIFSQFLDQLDIIEDFLVGLGLQFERLDGSIGTLEKQRRIDAFNAPDSPLFAFLLSTRAGGVGINLATADTVIIMDPDFNPHQDIQALSRSHRIGQKKKVLVFQLMTKDSAEEKIVQIGRKKMALDHVLIESLDQEEDAGVDLESILKHGATALFGDNDENDIHYNSASIDKLLDRTGIENTNAGDDKSAENAFSFARVWANDKGTLTDDVGDPDSPDSAEDLGVWDKLLQERAAEAAREAEKRKEALGKGKRVRKVVNYKSNGHGALDDVVDEGGDMSPKDRKGDRSDTDFAEEPADSEPDDEDVEEVEGHVDPRELEVHENSARGGIANHAQTNVKTQVGEFRRVKIAPPLPSLPGSGDAASVSFPKAAPGYAPDYPTNTQGYGDGSPGSQLPGYLRDESPEPGPASHGISSQQQINVKKCPACGQIHPVGFCTLKRTGHEHCGLCGLAHFGGPRACPHMQSETQVRSMLRALKNSTEPKDEIRAAKKYLQGVIGNLVLKKKKASQQIVGSTNGHPQGLENQPPNHIQSQSTPSAQALPPGSQNRPMHPSNGNTVLSSRPPNLGLDTA